VSLRQDAEPRLTTPVVALVASLLVLGVTLTWTFLSMRVVMDVGGACADGGPYVSAQPCPGGTWLIGPAIPLMLLAAFAGSFAGTRLNAPNLLIPMWAVLFGSLGWNFLEYGFTTEGGTVWGWVVCGVVFELMAAPAVYFILLGLRTTVVPPRDGTVRVPGALTWWLVYPAVIGAGVLLGIVSFDALR
jgi:hypothetical protein